MKIWLSSETDTASISFWWGVIDIWWQIASGLDQWEFPVAGRTGNFERIWYMHGGQPYFLASLTILPRRFSLAPAFRLNMVHRWRSQKIRLFCSLQGQILEVHNIKDYIITKSMRVLWLVNQLWVIGPVNPWKNRASSELLYKSNRRQVSRVYRLTNHLGCW